MTKDNNSSLVGKLLVAMPGIGDSRFNRAVILVCAHSEDYAMGLVLNDPMEDLMLPDLFDQLGIEQDIKLPETPVLNGGPVGTDRGFVIHSTDYYSDGATLQVTDAICMTATRDVLVAMASGGSPNRSVLSLGYAGWGPGQIEYELSQNAWIVSDPDMALVFGDAFENKWEASLDRIGIDPAFLHMDGGSA
ncbi:MAG: YqgE/AlgH family protein [Pseudomonadota bacterium]